MRLAGRSTLSLDRIRLQGDGSISVTGINSRNLTVALPGSGNIDATGTATKLDVTIGGEGNALVRQLIARDAKAALNGDGSIMLTATHSLTGGSRAAARCSMAATPRASPRRSAGAAPSALDERPGAGGAAECTCQLQGSLCACGLLGVGRVITSPAMMAARTSASIRAG